MHKLKLGVFLGTRPEIIKTQPVINEIRTRGHSLIFVHTGQHYDYNMSDVFIRQLRLPKPKYFLNSKASSQGRQTAVIIAKSEKILGKERPDMILVEGDTNSALGAALAASKMNIPIGHIEAGCRSFDRSMPEEINRVAISDLCELSFAPTKNCVTNLTHEGIPRSRVFLTGHPLVDLLHEVRRKIKNNRTLKKPYSLITIHRRENVDKPEPLRAILSGINELSCDISLVFPCHPHTRKQIAKFKLSHLVRGVKMIEPVSYFESLELIRNANFVMTDSGGVQQEAAILGTPCVTLRPVTEWIETVEAKVNFLTGQRTRDIVIMVHSLLKHYDSIAARARSTKDLFGKPGASKRILEVIEEYHTR